MDEFSAWDDTRTAYALILDQIIKDDPNVLNTEIYLFYSVSGKPIPNVPYKIVKGQHKKPNKWFIYEPNTEVNLIALTMVYNYRVLQDDSLYRFESAYPHYNKDNYTLIFIDESEYSEYHNLLIVFESIIEFIIQKVHNQRVTIRYDTGDLRTSILYVNKTPFDLGISFQMGDRVNIKKVLYRAFIDLGFDMRTEPGTITIYKRPIFEGFKSFKGRVSVPILNDVYKNLGKCPVNFEIVSDTGKRYFFTHDLLMCISEYYHKYFTTKLNAHTNNTSIQSDYALDYFQKYVYKIVNDSNEDINWIENDFDVTCIMELFHLMDYYCIKYEDFGVELLFIIKTYISKIDNPIVLLKEISKITVPDEWETYRKILNSMISVMK